jgi:uncharacterized membrane protein YeaQ/YmgE (transglycosylase-associated protein family)
VHLIWIIMIGFVAGSIAKLITPGTGPRGFWLTAAIGVAGSIAATYFGQWMGFYGVDQPAGFVGGVVGAALLLVAYHAFRKA